MNLEEKFNLLAEEVRKNMVNPDVDIELCFPQEVDQGCEVKSYPYLKVKYVIEGHDVYEKEIDIDPMYWEKDVKDIAGLVTFQIQQFMEEIDSVEYGGE
ncbi:MAG: hypothetical protein RMH93_06180 [Aquificaceae bacterium]|nr:hypothetical protein [Aquificaceae bacterium]MCS7196243.1 hypothetical protein [Aquificaceae bacterium]MDW8033117.1 hypothetical protein [Aquificaceae bacterium]MDW8295118.1 hypothetical protein [Aquificaceae bacterium]